MMMPQLFEDLCHRNSAVAFAVPSVVVLYLGLSLRKEHTGTVFVLLDAFVLPVTPPVLHIRLTAELQRLP